MILAINKLISFLFYSLSFLVPLIFLPSTNEVFEFNKIILVYFSTVIIFGLWIIKMIIGKRIVFAKSMLDIPLFLFLVIQIVSALFSVDITTSTFGYYTRFNGGILSLLCFALLFWAYNSNMDNQQTKNVINCIIIAAILASIYGIVQSLGIDVVLWSQNVKNRVFSTFGQPNSFAAWISAVSPFVWMKILTLNKKGSSFGLLGSLRTTLSKGPRVKPVARVEGSLLKKSFWILTAFLFVFVLLLTKSRSGFLGLLTSITIFTAVSYFFKKPKYSLYLGKILFIPIVVLVALFFLTKSISPQLSDLLNPESLKTRRLLWQGAFTLWKKYPVWGSGPETFAYTYFETRPKEHNLISEWDFIYSKAHNEYLNYAANTGTLGILSYLGLIVYSVKLILRSLQTRYSRPVGLAVISGYSSLLVTNFFGFSTVSTNMLLFLFPAVALTSSLNNKVHVQNKSDIYIKSANMKFIIPLLLTTFYLLLIVFRFWYSDYLFTKGMSFNSQAKFEEARKYLIKALSYSPDQSVYWNELAKSTANYSSSTFERGEKDKAESLKNEALNYSQKSASLSPRDISILSDSARISIILSEIDSNELGRAATILEKIKIYAPTNAKNLYNLSLVYLRTGNNTKGKEILIKAISLKPNYKEARFTLAGLYIEEGDYSQAKMQLEYILKNINSADVLVKETLMNLPE